MYEFRLPEDIHGCLLPQTIEDVKRYHYNIGVEKGIYNNHLTDDYAEECLKLENPSGIFRGFRGFPNQFILEWFRGRIAEFDMDPERYGLPGLYHLADGSTRFSVNSQDITLITSLYDPKQDSDLARLISKNQDRLDETGIRTYPEGYVKELETEREALNAKLNALPFEIKEEIIPAGTIVTTGSDIYEIVRFIVKKWHKDIL
jgi:hypothetical protein